MEEKHHNLDEEQRKEGRRKADEEGKGRIVERWSERRGDE
jgi:hypothetical protein